MSPNEGQGKVYQVNGTHPSNCMSLGLDAKTTALKKMQGKYLCGMNGR